MTLRAGASFCPPAFCPRPLCRAQAPLLLAALRLFLSHLKVTSVVWTHSHQPACVSPALRVPQNRTPGCAVTPPSCCPWGGRELARSVGDAGFPCSVPGRASRGQLSVSRLLKATLLSGRKDSQLLSAVGHTVHRPGSSIVCPETGQVCDLLSPSAQSVPLERILRVFF